MLGRYHLENYFLDEGVLANIFATMEPVGSWLRDPEQIRTALQEIARSMISYATALNVSAQFRMEAGNIDIMPKGCHDKKCDELAQLITAKATSELERIGATFAPGQCESAVHASFAALEQSLNDDTWRFIVPGKQLLAKFASKAALDVGRL